MNDASGAWISNSPDVTLTDKSGLGMFPTGSSITFTGGAYDKGVIEGLAAIEFRSYQPGTVTIEATSAGLSPSSATIARLGPGYFVQNDGVSSKTMLKTRVDGTTSAGADSIAAIILNGWTHANKYLWSKNMIKYA